MLVSVRDHNVTCIPICRMNCVWKHCLLLTERKLHVEKLVVVLRYCVIYFGASV